MNTKPLVVNGQEYPAYIVGEDGTLFSTKTNRYLKGTRMKDGYIRINTQNNGETFCFLLHRGVAETFLPNPNNLPIVHHKNHIRDDNRVENLEWVSIEENAQNHDRSDTAKRQVETTPLDENWRPIVQAPEYLVNEHGQVLSTKTHKILMGGLREGYVRYILNKTNYSAHRLVFEAFYGYCPECIDHIDGDRANNAIWNLREANQSENMKNAYANGHSSQIPVQQIDKEGNVIQVYPSIAEAARAHNVTSAAIKSAADRGGTSCGFYWKKILDSETP